MTLAELKSKHQTPMTLAAIEKAILNHGEKCEARITSGTISTRKGSNARYSADAMNAKEFKIYAGPRAGRPLSEGYVLIIVKLA
jgi:hypothetical protein